MLNACLEAKEPHSMMVLSVMLRLTFQFLTFATSALLPSHTVAICKVITCSLNFLTHS